MTSGLTAEVRIRRGEGFDLDATVRAEAGRTVALLGPNGAGKSTVVAAVAGLLALDAGRVELAGRVLDDPARDIFVEPADRNIGVVFQNYVLFPHLSVVENVAFGLRSRGIERTEARERATEWLEHLSLGSLAGRRPPDLSGGQAQRVALARALIVGPALLLLDEPLAALDATTRIGLRRVLSEHLASFDGPRLLITHDPTDAFVLADDVYIIESGRITQHGSADDIRLRPRTRYAADLAGANLIHGMAGDGQVLVGGQALQVADTQVSGPALATIHPRAIALHLEHPAGSPRNTWATRVDHIERIGDRVRVQLGPPLVLTAEITPGATDALDLRPGSDIWVSIKATEITVEPE